MVKIRKTILAKHIKQHKIKRYNPFLCLDFLSPDYNNSIENGRSCFGVIVSIFLFVSLLVLSLMILRNDLYQGVKFPVKNPITTIINKQELNVTFEIQDLDKKITDYAQYI